MERKPFRVAFVLYTTKLKLVESSFAVRDVYPGSRSTIFSIPDPWSASKNLNILTQKIVSRLLKYDPGCSSRIRILIFYPSRILDPGVKKAPGPGSRSATLVERNYFGSPVTTSSGIEKYFSTARQLNNPFAAMFSWVHIKLKIIFDPLLSVRL